MGADAQPNGQARPLLAQLLGQLAGPLEQIMRGRQTRRPRWQRRLGRPVAPPSVISGRLAAGDWHGTGWARISAAAANAPTGIGQSTLSAPSSAPGPDPPDRDSMLSGERDDLRRDRPPPPGDDAWQIVPVGIVAQRHREIRILRRRSSSERRWCFGGARGIVGARYRGKVRQGQTTGAPRAAGSNES
jgi:hypothetical protein